MEIDPVSIKKVYRALNFFFLALYTFGFLCSTICCLKIYAVYEHHEIFLISFTYIGTFYVQLITLGLKGYYIFGEKSFVIKYPKLFKKIIIVFSIFNLIFVFFQSYTYISYFHENTFNKFLHLQYAVYHKTDLIYTDGHFTLSYASMVLCTVVSFLFIFLINTEEKSIESQPEKFLQKIHNKQE